MGKITVAFGPVCLHNDSIVNQLENEMLVNKYYESIKTYLSLPKDIGFDYMEEIVATIEDEEKMSWTEAYEMFGELVDFVIDMERV